MRDDNKATLGNPNSNVTGGTVHIVHILDASSSMAYGGKYINALVGVNEDIEIQAKTPQDGVTTTMTVIEFSSDNPKGLTTRHYFMSPVVACSAIRGRGAHGNTPLFQTVGETIEEIVKAKHLSDKVLLKIFTDGEENSSKGLYQRDGGVWGPPKSEALTKLIKQVEDHHNFTVTFMSTKEELRTMEAMGFMPDNMLAHDNTASGIKMSYDRSNLATTRYRKALSDGESQKQLKAGFFKRLDKEENK